MKEPPVFNTKIDFIDAFHFFGQLNQQFRTEYFKIQFLSDKTMSVVKNLQGINPTWNIFEI